MLTEMNSWTIKAIAAVIIILLIWLLVWSIKDCITKKKSGKKVHKEIASAERFHKINEPETKNQPNSISINEFDDDSNNLF